MPEPQIKPSVPAEWRLSRPKYDVIISLNERFMPPPPQKERQFVRPRTFNITSLLLFSLVPDAGFTVIIGILEQRVSE